MTAGPPSRAGGPPAPRPLARRALALAWLLLAPAGPLSAQGAGEEATPGRVLGARLEATVPAAGPGAASTGVEIRYRVVADSAVRRIPLRGMAFFGATPAEVRATVGGEPAPAELDVEREPLLAGDVRLPGRTAPGDTLEVEVSYRLPAAIPAAGGSFDVVLPLLYVDWRPAGAPEDMLEATIALPAAYSIQEAFPTVPREITTEAGTRRYGLRLQTVPSMIRFRGHEGDPPLLTFSRLVDLGVVLLLVVAGALGWRALRRERARAAAADPGGEP